MLRIFVGVIQFTWTLALAPVPAARKISAVSNTPSLHVTWHIECSSFTGADEAAQHVDVVDREVEDDVVAAEHGVGIAADAREREVDRRAEQALADDLAELPDRGIEALDVTDGELHALRLRGGEHLATLGERAGDRLLDEQVLAHRDELERDVVMGRRRASR